MPDQKTILDPMAGKSCKPCDQPKPCDQAKPSKPSMCCDGCQALNVKRMRHHTVTIRKPGVYCFDKDVRYSSKACKPGQTPTKTKHLAVLRIVCSNVLVRMQGHTLSLRGMDCAGTNANANNSNDSDITGVWIKPGLDNVRIEGGTIRDFTGNGIQAGVPIDPNQATLDPAMDLKNLEFLNLRLLNNGNDKIQENRKYFVGGGALVIYGAIGVNVVNCLLNDNVLNGLMGVNVRDVSLIQSHFDHNRGGLIEFPAFNNGATLSPQLVTNGALIMATQAHMSANIHVKGCTFDLNHSGGTAFGLNVQGISYMFNGPEVPPTVVLTQIDNVLVQQSTAYQTTVTVDDPAIALLYSDLNNVGTQGVFFAGMQMIYVAGQLVLENVQVSETSLTIDTPLLVDTQNNFSLFNQACGLAVVACECPIEIRQQCSFDSTTVTLNAVDPNTSTYTQNMIQSTGIYLTSNENNAPIELILSSTTIQDTNVGSQNTSNNTTIPCNLYTAGISSSGSSVAAVTIQRVVATGNTSLVDSGNTTAQQILTIGIDVQSAATILIEDCVSSDHTQASPVAPGVLPSEYSYAAGISIGSNTASAIVRNCKCTSIYDLAGLNGAYGFTTRQYDVGSDTFASQITFDHCFADQCSNGAQGVLPGAGFDLFSLTNSKMIQCQSDNNDLGIQLNQDASNPEFPTGKLWIDQNVMQNNTLYGVYDRSTYLNPGSMPTVYLRNQAFQNGPTPATGSPATDTNYFGPLPDTPIQYWLLPGAPASTQYGLNNLSIGIL